jgi:hypothetical protein
LAAAALDKPQAKVVSHARWHVGLPSVFILGCCCLHQVQQLPAQIPVLQLRLRGWQPACHAQSKPSTSTSCWMLSAKCQMQLMLLRPWQFALGMCIH